jgi:hypothetical protein
METKKEYRISVDSDLKGLSIGVIESVVIDGEILTKPTRRCAFRKVLTDDNGVETINENFNKEVDEWTGEKDFIKNKYNF